MSDDEASIDYVELARQVRGNLELEEGIDLDMSNENYTDESDENDNNFNSTDEDMSTINGKQVDATANLIIHFALYDDIGKKSTSTLPIEKVFGVMLKESNVVLKFNTIITKAHSARGEKRKFQLIYLSEDPIDCKVKWDDKEPEIVQNLTCGKQVYEKIVRVDPPIAYELLVVFRDITISLSLKDPSKDLPLPTQIASSFNDEKSSDFIIECQEKEFHVHQYILKQRSEYFAGLLRNNCMERENKKIVINDFEPKVVEILLRYLYNGAVCWSTIKVKEILIGVFKIADKYNFTALVDAIDSYCAQHYLFVLNLLLPVNELATLQSAITIVDETLMPKLATLISIWKTSTRSNISDDQWSKLIRDYPNFAQRIANVAYRKDYTEWGSQHKSWFLALEKTVVKATFGSDSAIIVGPLGEMKGAVKCSSIL